MIKKYVSVLFIVCLSITILHAQDSTLVNALKKHVTILASDSMNGRGFAFFSKSKSIDYIRKEFMLSGIKPVTPGYSHLFIHKQGMTSIEGVNLFGVIEGSDSSLKKEYIVVGAHYDHLGWKKEDGQKVVFNGADDNASGVASVIEIAKYLAVNRHLLKRSVLFIAFDGEESGLLGSKAFLSDKVVDPAAVKIMFSIDMVGMYEKNGGVELNGMNSFVNGEKIGEELASQKNVKITKTKNTIEMRTDTWSFSKYDIPAIHVFTGTESPYHKPEDDSEKLDYQGMAKINDYMMAMTVKLSNEKDIISDTVFIDKSKTNKKFQVGLNIAAGSNRHHFTDEYFNAKSLFSFQAGLNAQLKASKNFIIQPEVAYEMYGSKSDSGNMYVHAFSPSLNLLLTTPNLKADAPFTYLLLGGYYRYNFAGKVGSKEIDFTDQFSQDDYGLNIGFGFQFGKYQMSYISKYGFNKVLKNYPNGKILNRSGYFTFSYFF